MSYSTYETTKPDTSPHLIFQTLVGLEVVVALLGLFALILSITSAIYCWIAATSAAIPDCCAGFFFRQVTCALLLFE